jgi:hypothetical protein
MPAAERARVKGVFNMDMTGSKDVERATYWCMMTVDGLRNLVTDTFLATGARLGYGNVMELGMFSSSDHVPFHNGTFNVGTGSQRMPAAMGMWFGRPANYTGPINGSNYTIEAAYHTPLDTMEDNVSEERMKMCIEVVTASVYNMAIVHVPAPVTSLKINALAIETMKRGDTKQFSLTINDDESDEFIYWTSANPALATVTNDGTVTVKNVIGTVVLTATDPVSKRSHSVLLRIAS